MRHLTVSIEMAVALALALLCPVMANAEQDVQTLGHVTVEAKSPWVDTGIDVNKGDVLVFQQKSGGWRTASNMPLVDGNGYFDEAQTRQKRYSHHKQLYNAPLGCLLAAVEKKRKAFAVGVGKEFTSPATGRLFLRINDKDSSLADNAGSIYLEITARGFAPPEKAPPEKSQPRKLETGKTAPGHVEKAPPPARDTKSALQPSGKSTGTAIDPAMPAQKSKTELSDISTQGLQAERLRWQGKSSEAVRLARAAADKGDPLGRFYLGWMTVDGEGTQKNPKVGLAMIAEALPKLQSLADAGDIHAQVAVGMAYFFGQGLPEDNAKAVAYIDPAAKQGDPQALYLLGFMYQHGHGKRESPKRAIANFNAAAESGHVKAITALFDVYLKGELVTQDLDTAKLWLQKAAAAGVRGAQHRLDNWDQEVQKIQSYGAAWTGMSVVGTIIAVNLMLNIVLVFRYILPQIGCLFSALVLGVVLLLGLPLLMGVGELWAAGQAELILAAGAFQVFVSIGIFVLSWYIKKIRFQQLPDYYRLNPDVIQRNLERMQR